MTHPGLDRRRASGALKRDGKPSAIVQSRARRAPRTGVALCAAFSAALGATLCAALAVALLGAGAARAAPAALAALAAACAAPSVLLERFIPAGCEACWRSVGTGRDAPLVLDWIVPDARGDDAALAAAAIAEARARAGALPASRTLERRHALAPYASADVEVEQGPPWYGYVAAQIRVARRAGETAPRAAAYLALVEQVRAGEEGTPIERMLVRGVVGPLPLDGDRDEVTHLHAFRIPQGSKPARLAAIGWIESPAGKVLAAARVEPEGCLPAR